MPAFDTIAVRQALRCLGSEPAPVPVDGPERVVLAGGGNEIAMALYRALGRGAKELSEPQMRQRQQELLDQFQREAEAVLRLLAAFRTVTSLEDYRAEARGLPEPVQMQATGTGEPAAFAAGRAMARVTPGATYQADASRPVPPSEGDLRPEEADDREVLPYSVVKGRLGGRVAPDMETCTDCGRLVAWIPAAGHYIHVDEEDLLAYPMDGHVVHEEIWKARHQPPPVQNGPAMDTEEKAKEIVKRAVEAARRDIDADRARTAHYDRDSGIEPGHLDTVEFEGPRFEPDPTESVLGRVRDRLARWRKYLDGYTTRELDELERQRRG